MVEEKMAERAWEMGEFAKAEALKLQSKYPDKIAGTRGLGLLFGIELTFNGADVWKALLENKMVCNLTQGTILRLVPPLTVEKEDITTFMKVLDSILATIEETPA